MRNRTKSRPFPSWKAVLLAVVVTFCQCYTGEAGEWGTLSGTFVADAGRSMPSELAEASKRGEEGGIKDVIVWLRPGDEEVPVHPDLAEKRKADIDLSIKDKRWSPRVLVFAAGSTLHVHNRDKYGHDGFPDMLLDNNKPQASDYTVIYDQPVAPSKSIAFPRRSTTTIRKLPAWPFPAQYRSHNAPDTYPAVMFSAPTPYWAVADENGKFVIEKLPIGNWRFGAWHESVGYIMNVRIDGQRVRWERGTFKQQVKRGDNRLGEIVVLTDEKASGR